ncbi:DUF4386 domain-containing protein [candidate division WWE3 bacterium]|uniref:DUF4386 domain-containing protein n=1 Tax=candidate division WWE3 bacterium TaxID=2053526 RepID=A0A955LKL2_UNCKA|nr:DUF4386 domain-containing protein [candidate division WWE3 bacterium]
MLDVTRTRRRAFLVGLFILTAYGVLFSEATDSALVVMIADVISGLSVMGIAVLILPYFVNIDKMLANLYLVARLVEGGLMVLGGFFALSATTESWRGFIYDNVHIYAFILGGFLFYWLLYKTKLVPRFISIWGSVAIGVLLVSTAAKLIHITIPVLDYLLILIITNEFFLAIWLMVKGFKFETTQEVRS